MIDELKLAIDLSEDKPKIKTMLLKIAEMPEDKQQMTLDFVKAFVAADKNFA